MVSRFSKRTDWMCAFPQCPPLAVMTGLLCVSLCASTQRACANPKLDVVLTATLNQAPVRFDQMAYTNGHGQALSVSRLDLLLSEFAVRSPNGIWLQQTNWQAWLALNSGRSQFTITNLLE